MSIIVYLIGLSYIAICSLLTLYPREFIDVLKNMFDKYPLKYLAGIPAAFAFLFLMCASATVYPAVFWIFGLLGLCKAILVFFNPNRIYSRLLDWYLGGLTDQTQRIFGITGIIFGTLIMTWAR